MASAKDCHELSSYYVKLYKEKYGYQPNINRVKARWSWDSMYDAMNKKEIKSLLDYYFTTASGTSHSLDWFFYNYDKLIEAKGWVEKDQQNIDRLRNETEERARRWREFFDGR